MSTAASSAESIESRIANAKDVLDRHAYETVQWHFHESTGSPFWLEKKRELKFDPLKDIKTFDDIKKFPIFEDDWLRGGPVNRWVPKGLRASQRTYLKQVEQRVFQKAALSLMTSRSTTNCLVTHCLTSTSLKEPTG